jgi:hypothetical protein
MLYRSGDIFKWLAEGRLKVLKYLTLGTKISKYSDWH